jgi:hypothetical protein
MGRGVRVGVAVGGLDVRVGRGGNVSVGAGVTVGVHVGGKVGGGVYVGTAVVDSPTAATGDGVSKWA